MAIVTTTLVPDETVFPYAGIPDVYVPSTDVSAGELRFSNFDEQIAATAAGDNQAVVLTCLLPVGYAYVLLDLSFAIAGQTAAATNNFDDDLTCNLQDSDATQSFEYHMGLHSFGAATTATDRNVKTYTPDQLPTVVVSSPDSGQVRFQVQTLNATANDQAYLANYYVRFLRYTILQANHYAVNTPSPVRG